MTPREEDDEHCPPCNIFGDPEQLVDSILRLHEMFTPVGVIARRLHQREPTVRFVVQRGRLPQQQLLLHWAETAGQPAPGRESQR
jgi:hypothetical protein